MRADFRVPAAVLILACAGALVYSAARAQSAPASAPAAHAPKLTEEQFKNIKVLKGIPADELIPAMQFITASLGVECEYCHVERAFEKDDKKPKRIAREMMTMMMNINKDNFEGRREVTCYSCHRGATNPIGTPLVATEESLTAVRPRRAGMPGGPEGANAGEAKPALPAADALFEKYLAAVGGAEALRKISSRTEKGSISFNGQEMPIEVFAQAPDKRVSVMHMPNGESITGYNGSVGWQSIPSKPPRVRMNTEAEKAAARIDADFIFRSTSSRFTQPIAWRPARRSTGTIPMWFLAARRANRRCVSISIRSQACCCGWCATPRRRSAACRRRSITRITARRVA